MVDLQALKPVKSLLAHNPSQNNQRYLVSSVRKVHAHDIHAGFHKLGQLLDGLCLGSNRANDFGLDLDGAV